MTALNSQQQADVARYIREHGNKTVISLNGHLFISRCVSVNYINRMKPLFFIMADLQGYFF
uniref:hypothetical protein n=1 Tax=Klebsiella pneumoniae TaxID=573 RepID=UPI001F30055C|nr:MULTISPECIES: hypothetical protein [Klebsiella]VXR48192.1 Uncharacterised protein [Klebsiella pneumoniae]VXZ93123.1 Uncharacterised protein [Klebsiella pneumoniae]